MNEPRRIGILGGRFDPIHLGHLATATVARRRLALDTVLLLPSRVSPHRSASARASDEDRLAMVRLAATGDACLLPCDLELQSDRPSYTSNTLACLRDRGHPATQLFFIVGADAFAEIATWHDYPAVLEGAHFVIVARPGHAVSHLPAQIPALRDRMHPIPDELRPGGVEVGTSPTIWLLDAVTPDISSTAIRKRLADGLSVTSLMPAEVSDYIARHRIYRSAHKTALT